MSDSLGTAPSTRPGTALVLGLGPVGSVAALALATAGVPVVLVERLAGVSDDPHESRASTFHPPTMEMLDELGVLDELRATALVADRYQHRDRLDGIVADFDLSVLAGDTRFPYRLQTEQSNLVRIIRARLEAHPGVRIISSTEVTAVRTDDLGAEVDTLHDDGTETTLHADWVVAADGANSVARRGLGITFDGLTYPEQFLVASTTVQLDTLIPDLCYVNYVSDPDEWLVLLRTPRHWRVLFPIPQGFDEAEVLDPARIEQRLQGVAPYGPGYDISHTTLYRVHQRVADRFREGRVLLVGDAAHINNPLGGMGMNSGIHDAVSAARAVVSAIGGDHSQLDLFAHTRRSVALEQVQKATHRNWKTMQESDPVVRGAHLDDLRATAADPVRAREYLIESSMLGSAPTVTTS